MLRRVAFAILGHRGEEGLVCPLLLPANLLFTTVYASWNEVHAPKTFAQFL